MNREFKDYIDYRIKQLQDRLGLHKEDSISWYEIKAVLEELGYIKTNYVDSF